MNWPKGAGERNDSESICLTYDDGPGEFLTPAVAKCLADHGVRATFFLLGRRAIVRPSLVDMLASAGHQLACHTYDHLHAWKHWPWTIAADIDRGYESLARWVAPDGPFRPPYGKSTPLSRWHLALRGARSILWDHDSMDTTEGQLPTASEAIDRVMRGGGGIVLLHDFDREGSPEYAEVRAKYVLEVTEGLIRGAVARGWPMLTIDEWASRRLGLAS